jgi:hypothetical protein
VMLVGEESELRNTITLSSRGCMSSDPCHSNNWEWREDGETIQNEGLKEMKGLRRCPPLEAAPFSGMVAGLWWGCVEPQLLSDGKINWSGGQPGTQSASSVQHKAKVKASSEIESREAAP